MKCYQEKSEFKPIILTIETVKETQTFFSLIDKLDVYLNTAEFLTITEEEKQIIINLSNALTCGDVVLQRNFAKEYYRKITIR